MVFAVWCICLAHPHFSRIEIADERLHCGAGAKLKQVAVEAKRHGLSGVEFLEGIPGSVGGALRMNAGAMGGATFDAVESVRFMGFNGAGRGACRGRVGGRISLLPAFEKSHCAGRGVQMPPAPREEIEERMNAFSKKRWDSQPAAPSAGCIFKNPARFPRAS